MATNFLQRKHEKLFSMLDTDGDGKIEQSDLRAHITATCSKFGVAPQSPKARALEQWAEQAWRVLSRLDSDRDNAVTMAEFVAAQDDRLYDQVYAPMFKVYFDVYDKDGNGTISEQELVDVFEIDGESASAGQQAFRALDTDGDGVITRAEFEAAAKEAMLSADPNARGNVLIGR